MDGDENKLKEKEGSMKKKTYEPPAIIYEAPLEATASICLDAPGKADLVNCTVLNS